MNRATLSVTAAFFTILIVVGVVGVSQGLRTHILTTASMGRSLPVGALALTAPTPMDALNEGDIITYEVGGDLTRTHRVEAVTSQGVITKGDLNGTTDPQPVHEQNIVGKVVWSLSWGGFAIKLLPYLLGGWLVMYFAAKGMTDPLGRSRYRFLGVYCGLALGLVIIKPMFGVELLSMQLNGAGDDVSADAHVVSTGMLPVQVHGVGENSSGTDVLFPTGDDGHAIARERTEAGSFSFKPRMSLDTTWIVGIAAFVLSPYLLFFMQNLIATRRSKKGGERSV